MTIMNIIIECAREISMYIFKCSVVSLSLYVLNYSITQITLNKSKFNSFIKSQCRRRVRRTRRVHCTA